MCAISAIPFVSLHYADIKFWHLSVYHAILTSPVHYMIIIDIISITEL